MKRLPLWVVYAILLVLFFILCAVLLVRFPMAVSISIDTVDGSQPEIPLTMWYKAYFHANSPFWVLISALLAGIGTAVIARKRKRKQ